MKLISIRLIILVVCLAGVALPVSGTQVLYKSVEQLGSDAAAVVMGTVVDVRSFWNDSRTKIFTATVVSVEQSFKGRPGGSVEVLQLGGTVDNVQVTAHGALRWAPGEEVVLFLEPAPAGRYQVSGFSQGKFKVVRDPESGAPYVLREALGGAQMVGAPGDLDPTAPLAKIALDKFLTEALGQDYQIIRE
jgi:hypothetical protein